MYPDALVLTTYLPDTGSPLAEHRDGSAILRLAVPPDGIDAARDLLALLRVGDGAVVRLVVVRD